MVQQKLRKKAGFKKPPWRWNTEHQKAFDDIKEVIACDVVLAYPDFNSPFEIYTDASSRQLGAVITQKNRPIAFFSRKLSDTQKRYTVTEQELLAIVETLKEFKGMLWGQKITIFTDHKNLKQDALGTASDRVYRWRLLLEEFVCHSAFMQYLADKNDINVHQIRWKTISKCFNSMSFNFSTRVETVHGEGNSFTYNEEEHRVIPLQP